MHSPLSSILSAHIARKWFRSFLILFTPSDLELSSSSRLFYGIFYLFILFWPCSIPAHFIIRVIIPPHFPLCTRALIHLYTSTRCCYFQHLSVVTISVTISFREYLSVTISFLVCCWSLFILCFVVATAVTVSSVEKRVRRRGRTLRNLCPPLCCLS